MKIILLARVSTEEQKEAGNSLPAQMARLKKYALSKGFSEADIIVFEFDESAYKKDREKFSEVIAMIDASKDPIALCCDKIDRLIRNFTAELVKLEDYRNSGKIILHFPSDNIILHKDSPATDLFRFTMGVSLAKYFSDSISDNVKRAFENKLNKGEWIG
jgi:site-specific DNA recombinase